MDKDLAEIFGMCVGDGCISITPRYSEFALSGDITEERSYYDNRVMPLLNQKLFIPILRRKLEPKAYPKVGIYGVITFDKRVVKELLRLGLKASPKINNGVPDQIKSGSKEIKRHFLRGLFDTDGSITFERIYANKNTKHSRPKISLTNVSKTLIDDCVKLCEELRFKVRIKKPYRGKRDKHIVYSLVIQRKSDVLRWLKEIGFKSPKHLTKIEIWRKLGYCPPFTTISGRRQILASNKI
jgi:intein/homing endonuclease